MNAVRCCLLLLGMVLLPLGAHAQFTIGEEGAKLELSPAFPRPGEQVTITLNAYTFDTTGASVRWTIDGVRDNSLANRRSISVLAGDLGERTTIQAEIALRDGRVVLATGSFTPATVSLTVDANTLVPSFYAGRPLPSIGSLVQVVAIPETAANLPREAYSYTWRLNGDVLEGGSVRGGYATRFQMPTGNGATIAVDVADETGTIIARRSLFVPAAEPELQFYEENALRGASRIAIGNTYQLIGTEATLRAEPYFMDATIFNQNPHLAWSINGQTVQNPSQDPQQITIQNGGGVGSFQIGFHLRNLSQLLQGVRDDFRVTF